jgi:hypothetical protein
MKGMGLPVQKPSAWQAAIKRLFSSNTLMSLLRWKNSKYRY